MASSLFDIGRPTGAMAGNEYAESTRRTRRDSDLTFKTKQAEFFDYIDGIEDRQQARKTNIAVNKATEEVLPSKTTKLIEENKTGTKQTQSNRRLIPANEAEHIQNQHVKMTKERYDNVARQYSAFQEAQRTGGDVATSYKRARQMLIDGDPNPARAEAYFNKLGMTAEATPQALQAMEQVATLGMHDAVTTRKEHLLHVEMGYRAAIAQSKARQGKDVSNALNKDYLELLGEHASSRVKGFDDLEGEFDAERGVWTKDKGAMIQATAKVAQNATALQILSDTNTTPQMVEEMGFDLVSAFNSEFIDRDISSTLGMSSDDFNSATFSDMMYDAYAQVEARRRSSPDPDKTFFQVWQENKATIIDQYKQDAKDVINEKKRATQAQREASKKEREKKERQERERAASAVNLYAENTTTIADINRKIKSLPATVLQNGKQVRNPEVMALVQQKADIVNARKNK